MWDGKKSQSPPDHLHDDLMREYYRLSEIVEDFDGRLTTVKGWGVTVSLAALGVAFWEEHYGIFLVAAVGAASFWVVEAFVKSQQRVYYPRMADIEVIAYALWGRNMPEKWIELATGTSLPKKPARTTPRRISSPLIDYTSWTGFGRVFGKSKRQRGHLNGASQAPPPLHTPIPWPDVGEDSTPSWLLPHVALPHAAVVFVGLMLFFFGVFGIWPIAGMPV